LESAQEVSVAVGLRDASVPVGGGQDDLGSITRRIQHAERPKATQLGCDLGTEAAIGEPYVDDGKIGFVMPNERDRVSNGAGDAADIVAILDENVFDHVRDLQIILGNYYFEQANLLGGPAAPKRRFSCLTVTQPQSHLVIDGAVSDETAVSQY